MAKALEDQVLTQMEDRRPIASDLQLEPTGRRVRTLFAGRTVADSRSVMLLIEKQRLAVYYFPIKDVQQDLLVPTSYKSAHAGKGEASFFSVKVGDRMAEKAAWRYLNPERPELNDYVAFYWDKMDAWFEEDEPLQGQSRVLVSQRQRQGVQGHRLGLPSADPGVSEDREPPVLLRREGRRGLRRRRAPAAAGIALVIS
ncbi:MAG: DUF427 domain-containing protein [Chloroflexi bacterium]|nr:MAG: DUF427 domain-containing protein [Chloroflexota bacterium]